VQKVSYGLLLLRLVLGLTLAAHGAQKLFGSFEGPGLKGLAGFFGGNLRFRAPFAMALLAALGEFGGGLLVAAGLLTTLGAFALVNVMIVAIVTAHWKAGFFSTKGGYEYNLLIIAAADAIAAIGPGRYSLDHAIGWDDNLSGAWWGVGVLVVAAAAAAVTLTAFRTPATATE
jgi:putative oxidoreductase